MACAIYTEGVLHISFMNNKEKGHRGEVIAKRYLQLRLYRILETNYARKTGEIDIIARKGGYTVFTEVKYRNSDVKGLPREAVTPFKQRQIKRTAMLYIMENHLDGSPIRFDVIEILGKDIRHIKNAF